MNEGEIRMQSQMYSLVAEMYALNAELEAYKSANELRDIQQCSPMYSDDCFMIIKEKLDNIARRLREEI